MLPILYGVSSAITWGSADFLGGVASKRTAPYRVLFLAELAGLTPLLGAALLLREELPPRADLLWAVSASLIGLTGLTILYRALANGQMTIAAPVSALLAAVIPVAFGLLTLGRPDPTTALAFGLALPAIWLISQSRGQADWRFHLSGLRLPLVAGSFFGLYFIAMHRATLTAFFWPLAAARLAGFLAFGGYALAARKPAMPPRDLWALCVINGLMDVAGNAFYVLAAQAGRMDIAAVLGALYPASTVMLAWIFLRERLALRQAAGVLLAFAAIILFTV